MKEKIEQYKYHLAAAIICLSGLFLFWNNLPEEQYHKLADEGNYYRQGKILVDSGLSGFSKMANVYIHTPGLQDAPHPLRLTAIIATSFAVSIHDSFRSISYFCLLNYILLLIGVFFFVNRYWGAATALLTVLLLAVSPLEMGMARRALMDMPSMTGLTFSCFAFWLMADTGKRKYMFAAIVLATYTILLKEANFVLLPFFGLTLLFLKWKGHTTLSLFEIVLVTVAPALLTVSAYLLAFGYDGMIGVISALNKAASNSQYTALWGQGPWYRIIIDYVMLSPFVVLLAAGYSGYRLFSGDTDKNTAFVFVLALYLFICYSILPKNIRYAILLDFPIRFMAAGAFLLLFSSIQWKNLKWIPSLLLLLLVALDVMSFKTYFLDNAIYDPISYNLLTANRIIPPLNYNNTPVIRTSESAAVTNAKNAIQANPVAQNYLALGLAYYNGGQFIECIMANREVIRLDPNNAIAYCNMGAAYNSLKDWNHAVEACKAALLINPNFQLAKNNLNWAMSQAALQKK